MRRNIIVVLALLLGVSMFAYGQTTVTNRGDVFTVQLLSNTATDVRDLTVYQDYSHYPTKIGESGKIVRFYDFAKLGGAASTTYNLLPAVAVKDNIVIRNGYIVALDGIDPVGAVTNSIGLNSTTDLKTAVTNTLQTAGSFNVLRPAGTADTAVQASSNTMVTATMGTVAVTQGVYMVVLDCELAP